MNYMSVSSSDRVNQIIDFIQTVFNQQQKKRTVIAVSGGIDSAVSLTLLVKAVGKENVTALLLPYGDQFIEDSQLIAEQVGLKKKQVKTINIQSSVDQMAVLLGVTTQDSVRMGNIKARTRMICVYDTAKNTDALVCGTENKSEHYLGYFTRFGDAASDLEPISQFYKTEVRQLAEFLNLPRLFLEKPPSAGLWIDQTDEAEMGFSYEQADQVLKQLIDLKRIPAEISITGIDGDVIQKVLAQVESMKFKRAVPYELSVHL